MPRECLVPGVFELIRSMQAERLELFSWLLEFILAGKEELSSLLLRSELSYADNAIELSTAASRQASELIRD